MPPDSRFSRPAQSSPLGKREHELKTLVDEPTRDAVAALACLAGMTVSEYLRELVCRDVYGSLELARLQTGRARGTAGNGTE